MKTYRFEVKLEGFKDIEVLAPSKKLAEQKLELVIEAVVKKLRELDINDISSSNQLIND